MWPVHPTPVQQQAAAALTCQAPTQDVAGMQHLAAGAHPAPQQQAALQLPAAAGARQMQPQQQQQQRRVLQ